MLTATGLLLFAGSGTGAASVRRPSFRPGMSVTAAATARTGECTGAQLSVSYFSSSGATGTGLYGIGIANSASTPCWLNGVPSVEFFVTSGSGKTRPLAVRLEPAPTKLFSAHPRRVTLDHAEPVTSELGQRYRAVSTGFIVLGQDIPANNASCVNVTLLSVRLPGVSRTYGVSTKTYDLPTRAFPKGVPAVFNLCDQPPPVEVTQIIGRSRFFSFVVIGA